jgi:hypothetical protein
MPPREGFVEAVELKRGRGVAVAVVVVLHFIEAAHIRAARGGLRS